MSTTPKRVHVILLALLTIKDIRKGINHVQRSHTNYNNSGESYPKIDLLECVEYPFSVDEVTTGIILLHIEVVTDEISIRLIQHLNTEEGGKLATLPLNQIKAPLVTYPPCSYVVKPLLKKLKYCPQNDQVLSLVSARKLICHDLGLDNHVAGTYGWNCITHKADNLDKEIDTIVAEGQKGEAKTQHEKLDCELSMHFWGTPVGQAQSIGSITGEEKKVGTSIASLANSKPGIPLPHHDICSIAELAQQISNLQHINPRTVISVKMVAPWKHGGDPWELYSQKCLMYLF